MRPRIRGYYCIALWDCLCHYVPAYASTNLSCLVRGAHWCKQLAKSHNAVGNRTHNPLAIADGKQCLWITQKQPDLQYILWQSYDNAKVAINLWRTSNLQNISQRKQGFPLVWFTCKIARSSEIVLVNCFLIFLREILARCKSLP